VVQAAPDVEAGEPDRAASRTSGARGGERA